MGRSAKEFCRPDQPVDGGGKLRNVWGRDRNDELGDYFRQVPGGIGDTFGGYTPGPGGLLEMEADQNTANEQFRNRARRARMNITANNTQTQVQSDAQAQINRSVGGGGSTGGGGFPTRSGSQGGFPIISTPKRGVVKIEDLPE